MIIKSLVKIVLLLSVIEIFLFLLLIFTSMTDEKPVLIARFFYVILKYVFGFPRHFPHDVKLDVHVVFCVSTLG